jgi:hypothetical protein
MAGDFATAVADADPPAGHRHHYATVSPIRQGTL